jgi:hypothetical protein
MPSSPNVPRLRKMLEGFKMTTVKATSTLSGSTIQGDTITVTSGTCNTQLTTLSSSFTGPATVTGTGLETCKFTADTTIAETMGDVTFPSITIPAGALITDMGLQMVTQCTAEASTTYTLNVGIAASGSQWISSKLLAGAGNSLPVGTVASVALGSKMHSGGAALTIQDGQFLHVVTSDDVVATLTVGGEAGTSGGSGRFYVKYTILK